MVSGGGLSCGLIMCTQISLDGASAVVHSGGDSNLGRQVLKFSKLEAVQGCASKISWWDVWDQGICVGDQGDQWKGWGCSVTDYQYGFCSGSSQLLLREMHWLAFPARCSLWLCMANDVMTYCTWVWTSCRGGRLCSKCWYGGSSAGYCHL